MKKGRAVFDALERYLRLLDVAPTSKSGLFRSLGDKETYETRLMYVFRKYDAARYHLANVKRLLQQDKAMLQPAESAPATSDKSRSIETTSSTTVSAHHYAYELAAFLEALKSALDFSASVCARHMPGMETDSIRTLIKLAKSTKTGPVYDTARLSLEWLIQIRDYRHHVVHRLFTPMHVHSVSKTLGGIARTAVAPVVVPRDPPKFVFDTRRAALAEEMPMPGATRFTKMTTVSSDGHNKTVIDHSVSFGLAPGYVSIDDFMEEHLRSFEEYFVSLLADLERLGFGPTPAPPS